MASIEGIIGEGSSDNPYQINNVNEFVKVMKAINGNGYAVLKGDIDFNDYNNGNYTEMLRLCNLNGDGHTIRNINSTGSITGESSSIFRLGTSSINVTIKNVNFEEINSDEWYVFDFYGGNLKLIGCNISCRCKRFYYPDVIATFENCTISIVGIGDAIDISNYGSHKNLLATFYRCHIKEHCEIETEWGAGNAFYPNFNYCKVEIDGVRRTTKDAYIHGTYSVYLITPIINSGGMYNLRGNKTNIIDITLYGNALSGSTTITYLTTEDMKSASKLQAAGFPVVAE